MSAKVAAALREIGLVGPGGLVTTDPRKAARTWNWVAQLQQRVPELRGGMVADKSHVSEGLACGI